VSNRINLLRTFQADSLRKNHLKFFYQKFGKEKFCIAQDHSYFQSRDFRSKPIGIFFQCSDSLDQYFTPNVFFSSNWIGIRILEIIRIKKEKKWGTVSWYERPQNVTTCP